MTLKKTPQAFIKRYEELKSRRMRHEAFFRDVRDYIRPRKQGIDQTPVNAGQRYDEKRFDSTAPDSARLLAHSMQNALTPASTAWFGLRIPDGHPLSGLNDDEAVSEWFQDSERKMFFTMHQSNFYSVIGEAFMDFVTFHTMCVYSEKNWKKNGNLVFKSKSLGRFVFDEDAAGATDTVFEEYEYSARQAAQAFGKDNLPEKIMVCLENKPDEKFSFLRCVCPREEYDERKTDAQNMPFMAVNIFMDGKEFVGEEGGYQEFPYAIARFDKATGEIYGNGPSDIAMPAIKTLNRLRQLGLAQRALEVHPPIFTRNKNVLGTFKWVPGAIITTMDSTQIRQAEFKGNLQSEMATVEYLVASIRRAYYADSLILPEKSNMTAEEVISLRQQTQQLLGPTVARFESEALVPIILRTFGIMMREGMFGTPPDKLAGLNEIDIKFVGQMARAQLLQDVTATSQWLKSVIADVMPVKPEVADNIDFDEIARGTADRLGVPKKFLTDLKLVADIRGTRAKEQQAIKQQQQLMALAEGVGKAGPGLNQLQEAMIGQTSGN